MEQNWEGYFLAALVLVFGMAISILHNVNVRTNAGVATYTVHSASVNERRRAERIKELAQCSTAVGR